MKRVLFIFLLFFSLIAFSQDTIVPIPTVYYPYPKPFPESPRPINDMDSSKYFMPKPLQPILGVGPNMLMFFGDIFGKNSQSIIHRIGYNISISEYLSRSFLLSAGAMFGSMGANENKSSHLNFQSKIRSGQLLVSYNFDKFLPKKRRFEPFILTGFEYFEYLSKTDLYDKAGNQYHYWHNGSIMNLDENDPNSSNAIELQRDYKYETDIRKWDNSIFGKYPEHSFAVPVGAGINVHIIPRVDVRVGATMHFSFTDYIDGVTEKNKGDKKKDKFLETYFTITYDLFNPHPPYVTPISEEDLLTLMTDDSDSDGVTDFIDSCQGTPSGIAVGADGCPPDSDGDGVPDYADKEINSPAGAFIDDNGVAMSDSTIARNWRVWSDTANAFVTYNTITNPTAITGEEPNNPRKSTIAYHRNLVILLGTYKDGVPPAEMGKLLSIKDVKSCMLPDSTTAYISGSFNQATDAEKRKADMIAAGFPQSKVMIKNNDGSLTTPTKAILAEFNRDEDNKPTDIKGVVFRVQLGAYSKKLSSLIFKNTGDVIEIKTEDGLYKYLSGSYSSIQDAIQQREDLKQKGYNGVFVVAYKDNKRIPVSDVSGGVIHLKNENLEETKTRLNTIDKNLILFKIQIGAYANNTPADVLQQLGKIPGLEKRKKSSGVIQYLTGKYHNLSDARKFKDTIINKYGIKDAFIVAFFKDEMISIPEALELLK